jgi:hypothetical protein
VPIDEQAVKGPLQEGSAEAMSQDDETLTNSLDATKHFLDAKKVTAPPANKEGAGGADRQLPDQLPIGQPVSAEEQARPGFSLITTLFQSLACGS